MSTKKTTQFKNLSDMTKAEARVLIANDVLKQLKSHRIVARQGRYVRSIRDGLLDLPEEGGKDDQVYDILEKAGPCQVCAIGAAFVSSVMVFSKIKLGAYHLDERGFLTHHLGKFFSQKQIDLMECAFEGGLSGCDGPEYDAAVSFYRKYDSSRDCLAAIFENIIKNNGTFKP